MKQVQSTSRSRRVSRSLGSGLALSLLVAAMTGGAGSANAANPGLLARAPSIQALHLPSVVANGKAPKVGPVASSQKMKLSISLPIRNQAELDLLLHDLQDPQSAHFHQYLSPEEFTSRFAPTQADYDAVVAWAQGNGLTVTGTSSNRRLIDIEADTATVNRAFNVSMGEYQHPSEDRSFISADREPTTAGLDVPLLQINGLNNFVTPHPHLHRGNAPVANASGSGPSGEFLPSDMRAAYYGSGSLTGAGQSIGILSFDGYKASDVTLFYSSTGMSSSVPINNVLVNGYSGACVSFNSNGTINTTTCDDGEQILDIVNAIGMAPGISQVLFYEGDPSDASADTKILNKMVSDNLAKVLSCSWGWGANQATDDAIFQQMAAQGQSFLSASGDSGAWGAGTSKTVSADYPSQSQYIIQVGGTDLTTASAGGAWSSETAWGNSGGGWDSTAPIPSWQQLSGVINSTNKGSTSYRNSPDVAMEANFDNPTVSNGQFLTGYGGTSFAAPRWAGFVALINQQSVANGNGTVGFFNSTLYNLGVSSSYSSNFHDITSGSNPAVNSSGTTISGGPSFNAVTGYDLVTGWGSPKAAFITTLAGSGGGSTGGTPTAGFSFTTSGLVATFTDTSTDSGGTIGTHSWTFGDGGTSTAANPSHTYASAGTYSVTETVADSVNTSATNSVTKSVTVASSGGGGSVLTNGVAVTGLSGTSGTLSAAYTFTVPAGATNVSIAISGGTGDADLYVKAGSAPTLTSYDCRPYVSGNSETCSGLSAGVTYYVKINAYSTYSGVSLVGNYTTGGGGSGNTLTNGVPVTGLSGSSGLSADYTLTVPAGKSSVTIKISGGTGDADLYVKLNAAPTLSSYTCRPYVAGNSETCTLTPPAAGGVYHVKLNAYSAYTGVSLTGSYN